MLVYPLVHLALLLEELSCQKPAAWRNGLGGTLSPGFGALGSSQRLVPLRKPQCWMEDEKGKGLELECSHEENECWPNRRNGGQEAVCPLRPEMWHTSRQDQHQQ